MRADFRLRSLQVRLPTPAERTLVVLTGARQVGKTTLARQRYPNLRYVSLDVAEDRALLRGLRVGSWARTVGEAVIDEAQKEPAVFEKVKHAFDARAIEFSVLLGSAQIALMKQVSETLAGRALIYELWPLMASELSGETGLLQRLVESDDGLDGLLADEPGSRLAAEAEPRKAAIDHLLRWGGMPALLGLDQERRRDWLGSYAKTYLERDLADLARVADLLPFLKFQQLVALRAAQVVNFADLGRDAGVSAKTARNYLEYLRISYQAFLLQPYHENLTSSVVKSPKVYWADMGLLRHLTGMETRTTGALFENLVVTEVVKHLRTQGSTAKAWYYATRSGLEIDLLIQRGDKLMGIEIKNRDRADPSDCGPMRRVAKALGDRWRGGLVVHRGDRLEQIDANTSIWAMPVHRLV